MLDPMEVFCRVLVLRRVTAANVPTLQAKPQMDPGVAELHAFRANVNTGMGDFNRIEVGAGFRHLYPPFAQRSRALRSHSPRLAAAS
jgi:hypothetical protein